MSTPKRKPTAKRAPAKATGKRAAKQHPAQPKRSALSPTRQKFLASILAGIAAGKKPGVIATLVSMMQRPSGVTAVEALAHLTKAFPKREPASMTNTISLNTWAADRRVKGEDGVLRYYRSK